MQCPQEPEEGVRSPGTGVTELRGVMWTAHEVYVECMSQINMSLHVFVGEQGLYCANVATKVT